MATVSLTVKQIINLGLWYKVCEYKGWDTWILNEGRIDEDEVVEFDDSFKKPEAVKMSDEIVKLGGNGLTFAIGDRMKIQDMQDMCEPHEDDHFHLYGTAGGFSLHKDDIDDLILLLQKVKNDGYKIE